MVVKLGERKEEVKESLREGKGEAALSSVDTKIENVRLYSIITLKTGCSIGYHEHINETEYYYILEGKALVVDDGEEKILEKDDTMLTPNGHSHSIENTCAEDLVFLATIVTH